MDKKDTKKIILFAGTNEGRKLCEFLTGHALEVTACVATEYGSLCLDNIPNLTVKEGRMSEPEIETIAIHYDYIVDATHPYAKLISENIKAAADQLHKPYIRIVRPSSEYDHVISCESIDQACDYLNQVEGNVLITTGSKELFPYTKMNDYQDRLYVRVLPSVESITECIRHGFQQSNLICMQGPFSVDCNIAMLKHADAKYLVTKDTGKSGGFDEKLFAAAKCNAKVIVIGRPGKEEGISLEEAYDFFMKEFSLQNKINSYFPIFLNLSKKKIVIIGAGTIAARRIKTLLKFGAQITVIAPKIHSEIKDLASMLVIRQKDYEESDIIDADIVLAATDDSTVNKKVYEDAAKSKIMVNIADRKELSEFYFPAIFSDEEIIGGIISRNGDNHRLVKEKAACIRNSLR